MNCKSVIDDFYIETNSNLVFKKFISKIYIFIIINFVVLKIWSFFSPKTQQNYSNLQHLKKKKILLQKFAKENVAPDHFKSPIK
jgi:uncharacterized membrane protein